mgnify:FL=1
MAWRDTEESSLPFTQISDNNVFAKEQKQVKGLKDFDFQPSTIIKEDITKPETKKFTVKQCAYCVSHKAYATISKVLEEPDQYECNLRQN